MSAANTLEVILLLLAAALALSTIAARLQFPAAAALVLGGILISVAPGAPSLTLDPELSLLLFLPPLLVSAGYYTVWSELRFNLRSIMLLSVGAVFFTTAIVGLAAHCVIPALPWPVCFALGAIVSPPDAVAAKAVFERLKAPRRLVAVLEGESLLNDASGIVLYRLAVAALLSGTFDAGHAALTFVWLTGCGIAVGVAAASLTLLIFQRSGQVHLAVLSSFLCAYAAYICAEWLHGSGVLSVVAAGIVVGRAQHKVFNAAARLESEAVWRSVTFVMEALIFILIGMALRNVIAGRGMASLIADLPFIAAVTASAVVARFIWVFCAVYIPRLISPGLARRDPSPPPSIPLVLSWAGMRGVVSLAIALSLPLDMPGRDLLVLTTFGFILTTILIQGTTLGPLMRFLQLDTVGEDKDAEIASMSVRVRVVRASLEYLKAFRTVDGGDMHPQLVEEYSRRVKGIEQLPSSDLSSHQRRRDHFKTALGAIAAGRRELLRLYREEKVSSATLRTIESELDYEELHFNRLHQL